MNWIINLFSGRFSGLGGIQKGSIVFTPKGRGTVTGGAINVRLDHPIRSKNGWMNPGFTFNLDELSK